MGEGKKALEFQRVTAPAQSCFNRYFACFLLAFAATLWIHAFFTAPIMPDTGYTLPMAREISQGKRLFSDLGVQHTTAVLFVFASVYELLGADAPYEVMLLVIYGVLAATIYLMLVLARPLRLTRNEKGLVVSATLLAYYVVEGSMICLEPFVVLCALLSNLALVRAGTLRDFVIAGCLCGLGVIAKQYGIFIYVSSVITLMVESRDLRGRLRDLAGFTLGAAGPVTIYLTFLIYSAEWNPGPVLHAFTGRWYHSEPENCYDYFAILITTTPYVCFFLLRRFRAVLVDRRARLIGLSFVFSLLPGLVRQYPRYYIHSVPYAGLLLGYLLTIPLSKRAWRVGMALSASLLIASCFIVLVRTHLFPRAAQRHLATRLQKEVPAGSRVVSFVSPSFMYLSDFVPVDPKGVGYNFLHNFPPSQIAAMFADAEYVILSPTDFAYSQFFEKYFAEFGLDIRREAAAAGLVPVAFSRASPFEVWVRAN